MFISALLVDYLTWRWLFALPVLLVIVARAMTWRAIPGVHERPTTRFDLQGSLLSIAAIVGMITFLHEGPTQGWTAGTTLCAAVLGVGATLAFVAWELRHEAPLLKISFFRRRGLATGSTALLIWFGVQTGVFIVLYPFFQAVLGWSGLRATAGLMPIAILMMGFPGVAPQLAKRIGAHYTLAAGALSGCIGLALIASMVSVDGGYLTVLPGMLVMGMGMGLSMAPATEAITASLRDENQGVASALNDVTREFGGALGVALLGAVFAAGYETSIVVQLQGIPADVAAVAERGIANALTLAASGGPYAEELQTAARHAFVQGWRQAIWAGSTMLGLLLVFVLARGPHQRRALEEKNVETSISK